MTYMLVDEMLDRFRSGERKPRGAESLGLRLVQFARGVAIYEMPVSRATTSPSGAVPAGGLAALAEAAMVTAATTTVPDGEVDEVGMATIELCGKFHVPVAVEESRMLRAEAIVVSATSDSVRTEADILADGVRVATFTAVATRVRAADSVATFEDELRDAGLATL